MRFRRSDVPSSDNVVRCDGFIAVLFPHFSAVLVERVFTECGVVRIVARTLDGTASCPARVHICYERRLTDRCRMKFAVTLGSWVVCRQDLLAVC